MPFPTLKYPLLIAALTLQLAGCGGGSSSSGSGTPASTTVTVSNLSFAQSHVLPAQGLSWTLTNASGTLHLVGGRPALVLVQISQGDVKNPVLDAWQGSVLLGSQALSARALLPPTEAGEAAYASDRWSAQLPGSWLQPGVSFTVRADNYGSSSAQPALVGADSDINLYLLPFYLFGANDSNTQPLSVAGLPNASTQLEIAAKWPVAALHAQNHAIGRISWPTLVIPPRADSGGTSQPAYAISSMDQQKDGFAVLSATLSLLQKFRAANGDSATNNQYYAPILGIDTGSGTYHDPGGGLGSVGGGAATGDYRYAGIFIHELGHGFGLEHAGDAYNAGKYPYAAGSLSGSVWGYDPNHHEFLNTIVPSSAPSYAGCKSSHQLDPQGRCYKQDPMQGGSGDQAPGYKFALFADYSTGKMQQWLEGTTTTDSSGKHIYSGGVIYEDANSSTGYSRWDGIDLKRVEVDSSTASGGLYGINQNLPIQRNVPVYAIAISYSKAGTAGASQIYPPLAYTGRLIRQFDPGSAQDLQDFTIDTGKYYWYCKGSGCDYTVRVTYADNSQVLRVLKDGFRSWFAPTAPLPATASDPLNSDSFKTWVINVPGGKAISKIELLDTPMAWQGLSASPTVLLSR